MSRGPISSWFSIEYEPGRAWPYVVYRHNTWPEDSVLGDQPRRWYVSRLRTLEDAWEIYPEAELVLISDTDK